jgi:hypothetical protein
MSNAIQFLESLGRFPLAGRGFKSCYANSIALLLIEDDQKHALMDLDADALNALLGGRPKMMMQVWAPMEDAPDGDEPGDKDGDGDRDDDRDPSD